MVRYEGKIYHKKPIEEHTHDSNSVKIDRPKKSVEIAAELKDKKAEYADKIKEMQNCIRQITDKSMKIQAEEARNKDLMTRKFAFVKESARNVRKSSKAATQYYKNMMQLNYVDPQFMDNKK